jgi:hypothetical protein
MRSPTPLSVGMSSRKAEWAVLLFLMVTLPHTGGSVAVASDGADRDGRKLKELRGAQDGRPE